LFVLWFIAWGIGLVSTEKICLENQTLFLQDMKRLFLFTAASGTCIIAVMAESSRLQTLNFGRTSAPEIEIVTVETLESSEDLDGGFW
jgi:hypothetical protein